MKTGKEKPFLRRLLNVPSFSIRWFQVSTVVISILTVVLFLISIPPYYETIRDTCIDEECGAFYNPPPGSEWLLQHSISPSFYALSYVILYVVFACAYIVAAAVLYWRKRNDSIGLLGTLMFVSLGCTFTPLLEGVKSIHPFLGVLANITGASGFAAFIFFFYIFPNGTFSPRWTMYAALFIIITRVPGLLFPGSIVDIVILPKWIFAVWFFIWVCSILAIQVYKFRFIMDATQRQQTKWCVYGIVLALGGLAGITAVFILYEPVINADPYKLYAVEVIVHVSMAIIPVTILMAILRRRLWNIDPVLNRTFVYAMLTACVAAIYVVIVWYMGLLFQANHHILISLVATSIVAVLFAPLKERLQRFVNKIMYGENDDPYSVLLRLGKQLEDPAPPEAVLDVVARTIKEALRLQYVAISLYQSGQLVIVAEEGKRIEDLHEIPLIHRGDELGILHLSPRSPGETFNPSDKKFLNMIVHQAGAVVQGVKASMDLKQLAKDLQESRERLVLAREEERRKLRGNLHDDLAPRLAALALTAAAAEELVDSNPQVTKMILTELQTTIRQTVSEIRSLVYDLRPPALDEMGLVGAIRERIHDVSVPLHSYAHDITPVQFELIVPDALPSLPAAVEVAAYRIVTEAIVNVVRHAKASKCLVRVAVVGNEGSVLEFEVADNGQGIVKRDVKNRKGGIGLESMKERAAELGGTCTVSSTIQGTRIWAQLPIAP